MAGFAILQVWLETASGAKRIRASEGKRVWELDRQLPAELACRSCRALRDWLRVWDRIAGDLVERDVEGESTSCAAMSLTWDVRPDPDLGPVLRLARDAEGVELFPTLAEAKEAEGRMRVQEMDRRKDAEQRIRELVEELRRLRGEG